MSKRLCLVFLMVLLFGVSSVPIALGAKGTVTVAFPQEPPTMDPNITTNAIGFINWSWSYDTLIKYDMETRKPRPWLAVRWEKLSPTKIKFYLRKDAVFSDGSPVTGAAVAFSLNRIRKKEFKSRQRAYYKGWDRFEPVGKKAVILHLKSPDNGLFGLINRAFLVTNPKAEAKGRRYLARNTMGSGAYILKSWSKGTKMVFEANPKWWGNKEYPNRPQTIVLRRIIEQTTRVKALLTGEVDFIQGVSAHLIPQIKNHPNTTAKVVPAVRIFFLAFANRFGGPMADVNVRKALNYAIDADKIRTTILGGNVDPFHSIYHPWTFSGHDPNIRWYGYDLAKAKAYLKKSAYPNGFKAEIVNTRGRFPSDAKVSEAVAQMVGKLGIDVKVKAVNFPLYRKTVISYGKKKQKRAGLVMRSWGNTFHNTTTVVRGTASCYGPWSVICYKDLDDMNEKAGAIQDAAKQQKAFEAVTQKMKDEAAIKVMYKFRQTFGIKKGLQFRPRGDGSLNVWEMVKK